MGTFINLTNVTGSTEKERAFFDSCRRHIKSDTEFTNMPKKIYAYWASKNVSFHFANTEKMSGAGDAKVGLQTGNNDLFYKFWFEVSKVTVGKWYPCVRGAGFRRWYTDINTVINWKNDGAEIKACKGAVIRNEQYYFRMGLSWSEISSGKISFRYVPSGSIYDQKGPAFFPIEVPLEYAAGYLNSVVAQQFLDVMCPTLDYSVGPVSEIPFIVEKQTEKVENTVKRCIECMESDERAYEENVSFRRHPLI